MNFSIGIVTFSERLSEFQILIEDIRKIHPTIEIIVLVNGNVGESFDQEYQRQLYQFCSNYRNIYLSLHTTFRSLGKLWNQILIHSSHDWVLLLNDDVRISNENLFSILNQYIQKSETTHQNESVVINQRWSHVLLNRREIDQLNWFDERFLGIGDEDHDIEWQYQKRFGHNFRYLSIPGIENVKSFKVSKNLATHGGMGFSIFNNHFFHSAKYQSAPNGRRCGSYNFPMVEQLPLKNQYPYENFYWQNKHLLEQAGRKIIFSPTHEIIYKTKGPVEKPTPDEILPFIL